MHWKVLLLALSVAPLSGCLLARNTARNVLNEPAELHDNKKLCRELRREAEAAWAGVRMREPQRAYTTDFADGFVDGYVDYLDSGGTAQPPAVPPIRYRRSRYMSVEGHALIRDYFCGFRYGCEAAVASGRRDLITVPILLSGPPAETPVQARQIPAGDGGPPPRTPEILPPPRPAGKDISLPFLDRPLSAPAVPLTELRMPIEAPRIAIPAAPDAPAPAGPQAGLFPMGVVPMSADDPDWSRGLRPPLRDLPNRTAKPHASAPETPPLPPWRGD